jgi:hypothetical protein
MITDADMTIRGLCETLASAHASAAACCRALSGMAEVPEQTRSDLAQAAAFFDEAGRGAINVLLPLCAPTLPAASAGMGSGKSDMAWPDALERPVQEVA